MKEVVYILIGLVLLASANAVLTDSSRVILEATEINCNSTGNLLLNMTHEGMNVLTKDIQIIVIHADSNTTIDLSNKGMWTNGYGESSEINQTGSDFYDSQSTLRFFSDPLLTSAGSYELKVSYPGGIQPWQTLVTKAFDCPGVDCSSDDGCDSGQRCSSGKCINVVCSGCDIAMNHKCSSKCDDGNACTQDACDENNGCLHTHADNCCSHDSECSDGNNCTTDKCVSNKCSNAPLKCAGTIDPCAIGTCLQSGGCSYSTDYKCQLRRGSVLFRAWYWFLGIFS